jgi:hypothetical protein
MQRWKCAVGAIVLIAVAGGSVAGCGKSGNAKQNAAQAKAKPKADPKAAKADPKAAAAKTDSKAAKPAQTAANTPKTTAPAPKATAPVQTATSAKTSTQPQPAAATTKPATPAPAQKTAQPAANTKTTAPVNAAATKPATTAVPVPAKPAAAAPAPAKPAAAPAAPAATTAVAGDVQQTLQTNKTLTAQLQSRLPAGTDVVKVSMGFRNLTQFVSAVHACQNLSIPFDKMRTAMVDEKKSLSAAIRALKPTASATIEAQRADYDARGMIYQAQHTETPAPDSTAKKGKPATTPGVER